MSDAGIAEVPRKKDFPCGSCGTCPIVELLVASGLASSKSDARRGIQGRGFYLNDEPIEAADLELMEDQLQGAPDKRFVILRKGKRNYVRLVLDP